MNAKELRALSLAELTVEYNKYAAKPVKKFACSKAAAVEKVLAVMPKTKTKTEPKARGIGNMIIELIKAKVALPEVLVKVQSAFPEANTKMASVYWYSSKIRCGQF